MSVPRIGRADRLAALRSGAPPGERALRPRVDPIARFAEAADVAEQLERLPAALDELGGRLRRIVHRDRAGRRDDAADAAALLALDELRDRAWTLFLTVGRSADPSARVCTRYVAGQGRHRAQARCPLAPGVPCSAESEDQ